MCAQCMHPLIIKLMAQWDICQQMLKPESTESQYVLLWGFSKLVTPVEGFYPALEVSTDQTHL